MEVIPPRKREEQFGPLLVVQPVECLPLPGHDPEVPVSLQDGHRLAHHILDRLPVPVARKKKVPGPNLAGICTEETYKTIF